METVLFHLSLSWPWTRAAAACFSSALNLSTIAFSSAVRLAIASAVSAWETAALFFTIEREDDTSKESVIVFFFPSSTIFPNWERTFPRVSLPVVSICIFLCGVVLSRFHSRRGENKRRGRESQALFCVFGKKIDERIFTLSLTPPISQKNC